MITCNLDGVKQLNFLRSLSNEEKKGLQANSTSKRVRKGTVIFAERELLQSLFCIKEGACKFSVIDERGKEIITHLLGKGDIMGRRAMISKRGALVTATAITDATLCCIYNESISDELSQNNNLCMDVLKGYVGDEDERYKRMGLYENQRGIKNRLAGLLLYLKEKYGTAKNGELIVSLKRADMANLLGTSSEYIISLLATFKKQDIIGLYKGKIRISSELELSKML